MNSLRRSSHTVWEGQRARSSGEETRGNNGPVLEQNFAEEAAEQPGSSGNIISPLVGIYMFVDLTEGRAVA
jgi:hypothetical protein